MKNFHEEHRKRVKEKFMANGFSDATPPHEILEMVLYFSIPRRDTNVTAHALIDKFGSLSGVFDASEEELLEVNGIGKNTVVLLKMILEVAKRYLIDSRSKSAVFSSLEEIGTYLVNRYIGVKKETVSVLCLDASIKMLSFDVIAQGDACAVGISTREILSVIQKTSASAIVLAHNHPNSFALPSESDVKSTIAVSKLLNAINVKFLDHMIISNGDYVSMVQSQDYKRIFEGNFT